MAIITRANGRREIRFLDANKHPRVLRLGHCSKRNAAIVQERVREIVRAQRTGSMLDPETRDWLERIGDELHRRLVNVGLVAPRAKADATAATLGAFIDNYIAERGDLKPNTIRNLQQARRSLVAFFTAGKRLDAITVADAKAYRRWLPTYNYGTKAEPRYYAEATIAQHVKKARELFRHAVDARLIIVSPFANIPVGSMVNETRAHFVPRDAVEKIIDACPDTDWRLIVSLSRYGGLRCPSEVMLLRWGDVLWDANRLLVRSPKTERQGKASRFVPIFPELRGVLVEAFEAAPEGAEYVISRHRDGNANLRTQLMRIMARAGVQPWPRLFHNMRASRETELAETFPLHVVCAWIGNSSVIAAKHYLQVTDEHFNRAVAPDGEKAAQKAAH